jgi:hypothetical protein
MSNTLIDFAGKYGTPFAVYEAEQTSNGEMKLLKSIFVPHAAQIAFFSATERYVLLHGNRGCGKSASLLWKAIQTAYLVPGSRIAIFRKTWPELQRSVWDELLKLPQDLFESINSSNHTVTIRAQDRDGQWKQSKIWFVTGENVTDARKVLGFEVHTLLIDEWAEVELEIWRFMSGSVRSPLAVTVADTQASAQILGASTPGGAGAEALKCLFGCDGVKKQAPGEDKSTYRPDQYRAIKASIDQNPTYAIGTPAGEQYRSSLTDLPPALQAKWVRGEWGAVEGCYFAIWDRDRMVIPFAKIHLELWYTFWISIDYGFGHSSAAAYLHVCLPDGLIITIAEIVERHMPAYEFAEEIIRRFELRGERCGGRRPNVVRIYQDPANKSQTGTGHSVRDQINERLADCDLAAIDGSNDRIGGWQLMYQMLTRGQWLIADTCPLLISAVPSRVHDPRRPGDLIKVGGDPLDDAMDAARYGLYSWVTASEKPRELLIRERLRPLAELGDMTSAYVRYKQLTDEPVEDYTPLAITRGGRRGYLPRSLRR